MIDFIKGNLVETGIGWVVIETHGVAYRIEVPAYLSHRGWDKGLEALLYTRLIIKEDGISLYGFYSSEERNLFNQLLGVTGYGPRLALSVLNEFSVSQFYVSVLEENVSNLSKIPGVGKKTAQRLILELKEKLPPSFTAESTTEAPTPSSDMPEKETIEALSALGFSISEATSAVEKAKSNEGSENNPEELLKSALKLLSKH